MFASVVFGAQRASQPPDYPVLFCPEAEETTLNRFGFRTSDKFTQPALITTISIRDHHHASRLIT